MRSLTYHVAVSIDGYIAAPDGSFDAFVQTGDHIDALLRDVPETLPGHVLSAIGIDAANDTYDTVVMGWNTFAVGLPHGIDDPYPHLRQYVFSRTHQPSEVGGNVHLVADDPIQLVRQLKAEPSTKDICCVEAAHLQAPCATRSITWSSKSTPSCSVRGSHSSSQATRRVGPLRSSQPARSTRACTWPRIDSNADGHRLRSISAAHET